MKLRAGGVENPRKFVFGSAAVRESTLCVCHPQVGQNGAGNNCSSLSSGAGAHVARATGVGGGGVSFDKRAIGGK